MTEVFASVRDTDFCLHLDEKKEKGNPCGLSIIDTDSCIYVCLVHGIYP